MRVQAGIRLSKCAVGDTVYISKVEQPQPSGAGSAMAELLLGTGDAFLLEHNEREGRDAAALGAGGALHGDRGQIGAQRGRCVNPSTVVQLLGVKVGGGRSCAALVAGGLRLDLRGQLHLDDGARIEADYRTVEVDLGAGIAPFRIVDTDGLTLPEFFFHAMGGREGLIDTATYAVAGAQDAVAYSDITYSI